MLGVTVLGGELPEPKVKFRFALEDYVQALAWSEGKLIASSVSEAVLSLDINGSSDPVVLCRHQGGCLSLSCSISNPKIVASGGQDGRVNIIDTQSQEILCAEKLGDAWIDKLSWSKDGRFLAAAVGKSVFILSPEGEVINELKNHPSTVSDLSWSANEESLAVSHYGGISIWFPTGTKPKKQLLFQGSLLSVAWQPNGKNVVVGSQDATVQFWNLKTSEQSCMRGYPTKVRDLAWSSDSRFLATSGGPDATVWNFAGRGPQGSTPITLSGHIDFITRLQFHPLRNLLATGGQDGRVHLFDPELGDDPIARLEGDGEVGALLFSPDGSLLAFGDAEGVITVVQSEQPG